MTVDYARGDEEGLGLEIESRQADERLYMKSEGGPLPRRPEGLPSIDSALPFLRYTKEQWVLQMTDNFNAIFSSCFSPFVFRLGSEGVCGVHAKLRAERSGEASGGGIIGRVSM